MLDFASFWITWKTTRAHRFFSERGVQKNNNKFSHTPKKNSNNFVVFFLLLLNQIRILIRCCRDAKKTVSLPTEEVCVLYECVFFFLNNIGGTGRKRDAYKVARGRIFCREWIEKDVIPTCGLFNNIYDSSVRKGHIWQIFL